MNLYFRLFWLIIKLLWEKKDIHPLAPTLISGRVMLNDLDFNLHVNNGRYLTLLDLGRIHLMAVTGLLKPTLKNRWLPVVGSIKVHFIRSLGLFDQFTIVTQVVYWDDKWIYMEQKMLKGETLYLTALVKGLFTTRHNEKIPPHKIIELLPIPIFAPPLPDNIKYWQESEKASRENGSD